MSYQYCSDYPTRQCSIDFTMTGIKAQKRYLEDKEASDMNQSKRMKLDETEALNDETIENSCESNSFSSGWQNLPDVIMRDFLSMVGQNSLEDLHKSRQVSQSWNESLQLLSQNRREKTPSREKLRVRQEKTGS